MSDAIRVEGLNFAYNDARLLRDVGLRAPSREITAILGPNGSGKSTLLRCLSRALPLRSGKIFINNRELDRIAPRDLARTLAYLPQTPYFPPLIAVREYILLGRYPALNWTGLYSAADRDACRAITEDLRLTRLADRRVDSLSGGEKQTVALACALAQIADAPDPLLLMDEATANMDPRRAINIMKILRSRANLSVLAVFHDFNLAALFADRLIGLKNGRVIFEGSTNDVFTAYNLAALYDLEFVVFQHPELAAPQAWPRVDSTDLSAPDPH